MKILIATGIYPPSVGGPATYSKLLHDELPKRSALAGIDMEVAVYSFDQVRHLPKLVRHIRYFFGCWNRLRGTAANARADIIFAQDTVSAALPALCAAWLARKPFLVRVPGDYAWEQAVQRFGVQDSIDDFQKKKYGFRVELLRSIQRFVVGRAALVITPSHYFERLVGGWFNQNQGAAKNRPDRQPRVVTIYNGIDLSTIPETLPGFEPKTIISAGRLVPWKGFAELIKSLTLLPDWHLAIAGDGPDRQHLEKIAADSSVADRVSFLGTLSRPALLARLQASELFALNTSFESFSFQVVEAMAAGVPVLATTIGSLPELIENGVEGLLVMPDDTRALVAAIEHLHDPDFRRTIILAALRKAGQFSISRTLDALVGQLRRFDAAAKTGTNRGV